MGSINSRGWGSPQGRNLNKAGTGEGAGCWGEGCGLGTPVRAWAALMLTLRRHSSPDQGSWRIPTWTSGTPSHSSVVLHRLPQPAAATTGPEHPQQGGCACMEECCLRTRPVGDLDALSTGPSRTRLKTWACGLLGPDSLSSLLHWLILSLSVSAPGTPGGLTGPQGLRKRSAVLSF